MFRDKTNFPINQLNFYVFIQCPVLYKRRLAFNCMPGTLYPAALWVSVDTGYFVVEDTVLSPL